MGMYIYENLNQDNNIVFFLNFPTTTELDKIKQQDSHFLGTINYIYLFNKK